MDELLTFLDSWAGVDCFTAKDGTHHLGLFGEYSHPMPPELGEAVHRWCEANGFPADHPAGGAE